MKKPIPFGNYYLLERINVGGMAEVFRAKEYGVEGFERLVAVKRILPNIAEDQDFIEMFVDEAKIAVQLNHANIAQVFTLGNEDGAYYIALEHIHGRDLRAIFDRRRNVGEPMPVSQACFVTMKVCEGLDYAHNKRDQAGRELGLVHRDVSPQNVLVSFEGEVKLIDFGIAKAAGKGQQTQAGILKGKFGYMSPEQVRGLPIDRRSDVFSCGIVLYELLTGERLFVGESDFSTLEKVRNVEILPPSTYNRKIQPELERIVLKALAKDVEDRYQNAIDLHDELQAFVYTAGEFYSRKDLAGWMKQEWAKELKEESAKIASYRDIRPPELEDAGSSMSAKPRRSNTISISKPAPKRKTAPPPIPGAVGRGAASKPPPVQQMQASAQDPNLEWDDDELETSIYDEEPNHGVADQTVQTPAPVAAMAAGGAMAAAADTKQEEPDLSSLVSSAKGWDTTPERQQAAVAPDRVADGSNKTKSPFGPAAGSMGADPMAEHIAKMPPTQLANEAPAPAIEFGASISQPRKSSNLMYALIAASILVAGGIVAIVLVAKGNKGSSEGEAAAQVAKNGAATDTADSASPAVVNANPADTGFDLIVDPAGVKVSLDGRPIGKAPLQIRSISPGEHFIEIEAPGGFLSRHETVKVEAGKAERVLVRLDAMDITGNFVSDPPDAKVFLVENGVASEIGRSPIEFKLNPRKNYEVLFKKDGYANETRPVAISGSPTVTVSAIMKKGRSSSSSRDNSVASISRTPSKDGDDKEDAVAKVVNPKDEPEKASSGDKDKALDSVKDRPKSNKAPVESGTGTLLLGAKPPCQIFIDGRDTGKKTPQRNLELSAGSHRITLINNEFGIKESFTVKIKPGASTKAIKNFTDQIK